jgi:hypothetical protein
MTTEVPKNSDLPPLLGGAALQRCDKGLVLNPASAAEVTPTASVRVFRNLSSPEILNSQITHFKMTTSPQKTRENLTP